MISRPTVSFTSLRYQEEWPLERPVYATSTVRSEEVSGGKDNGIRKVIGESLYNRRFASGETGGKGDLLVADNVGVLHTREGFSGQEARELGKVHVD